MRRKEVCASPLRGGHRAALRLKEGIGAALVLRRSGEAEAKDPIRLHTEAVKLVALLDLDLPPAGQAQPPVRFRRCGKDLLGPELHPFRVAAGDLEGHRDLGDSEGVAEELVGDVAPSQGASSLALGGEDRGALDPQGIDQRL